MYDGTTNAAGTPVVTSGMMVSSDTLTGGTFAFVSKNAGTNVTVNVSGISVNDGNAGGNYSITQAPNNTSNISQASLTISGVTANNKTGITPNTVATLSGTRPT